MSRFNKARFCLSYYYYMRERRRTSLKTRSVKWESGKRKVNLHSHNHRLKKIKKPETMRCISQIQKQEKNNENQKSSGKAGITLPLPLTLIIFGAYISRPLTSTKVKDRTLLPRFSLRHPHNSKVYQDENEALEVRSARLYDAYLGRMTWYPSVWVNRGPRCRLEPWYTVRPLGASEVPMGDRETH
jgi:hypothetical protein